MVRSAGSSTDIITDITLDTTTFDFGRALLAHTDSQLELVIPEGRGEQSSVLVWMEGMSEGSIEADLGSEPSIQSVTRLRTDSDRVLFRVEVTPELAELLGLLLTEHVRVLEAIGNDHGWRFKLQFPSGSDVQSFRQFCVDAGIEYTVERLYHPQTDDYDPDFGLTPQQREALLLAVEEDYFTVPRESTTTDIGERIGISDQAVSERIRRAVDTLVSNTLDQPKQQPPDDSRFGNVSKSE